MVGNYVVFDAVEEVVGDYAHFHQVPFDAVGSKANNASCPTARHAGNLQQLIFGGVVNIDSRFRGRRILRSLRCAARISVVLRDARQTHTSNCNRPNRESRPGPHHSILCFVVQGLQARCVSDL